MAFTGFGEDARSFFVELGEHNTKAWFDDHRDRYEQLIREPAEAFIRELGEELAAIYPAVNYDTRRNGAGSLMRINRDIRFSPDKRPYKENLGIVFWMGEGKKVELPAFYFHFAPDRAFFYGGQHLFPKPVLQRYREAVDEEKSGGDLEEILTDLGRQGLPCFEAPHYKRLPRGYDPEHTRANLLKYAGMGCARTLSIEVTGTAALVDQCVSDAARMERLIAWVLRLNSG